MNHLAPLITDLALILGVAAITTLLFRWLKQPLVVGYIMAGIIISPNFRLFPTVYEFKDVQTWGEIGVIFLLFNLGLEFSFKKVMQTGGSASVAALFEAFGMSILGFFIGKLLGWPFMDCIFLGAALTISSSTILVKTFDELGLKQRKFANMVFGILVFEDIIAVTLLILLGTFASSHKIDTASAFLSVLKLTFFVAIWFLTGIFFIPSILSRARKFLTDELLLLVSIALCLAMVYVSVRAGFSPALGAFVMGSLLAETTKAERIERLMKPVSDLFGAIFFVSVGMVVDIYSILPNILPIVVITAACIFGKILTVGSGTFISGNSLRVSLQTGMSLSLIGEFSFIIASLGNSLKVTSGFLYPIIVLVSTITAFTSPMLIKGSTPLFNFLDKKLTPAWQSRLTRYSTEATAIRVSGDWQKFIRNFIINTLIYSFILAAIIIITGFYLLPRLAGYGFGGKLTATISLTVMTPFLWALLVRNEKSKTFAKVFAQKKYIGPIWLMRLIKVTLAIFFIVLLLQNVFSARVAVYATIVIISLLILFRRQLQNLYDGIEHRFIRNLNNREIAREQELASLAASRRNAAAAPWDAHMTSFEVVPEATDVIGKTLDELQWRERAGINVALIKRGVKSIVIPDKKEKIFPGDKLFVICTDGQEKRMAALLRPNKQLASVKEEDVEIKLDRIEIIESSSLLNKTIRESDIKNLAHALVVGIEREGKRILNPESTTKFELGDIVWVVGDKKLISKTLVNKISSENTRTATQ